MKKIAFFTDTHLGQEVYVVHDGLGSEKMNYREEPDTHKENLTKKILNIDHSISLKSFTGISR